MTRYFWLVITVILMLALPLLVPADHRDLAATIVWSLGLAVVSYLGYPQPKDADGCDKIIEGLTVQVGMLESALTIETANVRDAQAESGRLALELSTARESEDQQKTLALGDDPRIEIVYGSGVPDRTRLAKTGIGPRMVDIHNTQNRDVLARWVREGRKTWANTALRTSDGNLYFLREGAPVNLISNLVR